MLQTILLGTFLPAIIASIILGAAFFQGASKRHMGQLYRLSGAWVGGVAVALGCIVGYGILLGYPRFLPIETKQWFPYFAAAACGVGLLEHRFWKASESGATGAMVARLRWMPRVVLIAAVVGLSLRPLVAHAWPTPVAVAWLAGSAIAFATLWLAIDGLSNTKPEAGATGACALAAVGSSVVLMMSGSALLALLAGGLATVLATISLLQGLGRIGHVLSSATPVIAAVLITVWLQGYFYSDVPEAAAILLLFALPLGWTIPRIWQIGRTGSGGLLLRLGSVALPIAAAIAVAWRARPVGDLYY